MDVHYLHYIVMIAKKKNMTQAANELYVTQSTLSQYLSKLESELGTPLFYRNKNTFTLTPAGKLYVKASEEVIQIQKRLYQNINELQQKGSIRIGVTSHFALDMLCDLTPSFKTNYPEFTIEITEGNPPTLKHLLSTSELDCAIMALPHTELFEQESVHILGHEEILFGIHKDHVFAKKYDKKHSITAKELYTEFKDEQFLLSKKGNTLRFFSDHLFRSQHFEPKILLETNSIHTIRSLVSKNLGVAFFAKTYCPNDPNITFYSLSPKQFRVNTFIRRNDWITNEIEEKFCEQICSYYSSDMTPISTFSSQS